MNKLPVARTADIVVQTLDKEVLIYDLNNHKAFNLNETSSAVYQACDGKTTFDELRIKNNFTDDLIFLALDELKNENLIEDDNSLISPFKGMTRREAIRKVGLASMIALPVISSLLAPTAAMAQSAAACAASGQACIYNNATQSNCCSSSDRCVGAGCEPCTAGGNSNQSCFGAGCCAGFTDTRNLCCSGAYNEVPDPFLNNRFNCTCV